jgi:hypothetical protein
LAWLGSAEAGPPLEQRLLVLERAVDQDALDAGVAAFVDGDESCELLVDMLAVTGAVAAAVYEWVGLEILRGSWVNPDLFWLFALVAAGLLLMTSAV